MRPGRGLEFLSEMTSVLLAIGDKNLASVLRKILVESEYNFDVLYDEVLHRRYLFEMTSQYHPNIVILHDNFLPGDKTGNEDKDTEMLEILQQIRLSFDQQIRIVYICIRPRNDPFFGKLIGLGVHDIFYIEQFSKQAFVEQLASPPKFANIAKLQRGEFDMDQLELEEEEAIHQETEITEDEEKKEEGDSKLKDLLKSPYLKFNVQLPKIPLPAKVERSEEQQPIDDSWLYEESKEKNNITSTPIIGTVVIAVTSVEEHLGATNTAISIATYLHNSGCDVALVEANNSKDFDRIHSLIEGEKLAIDEIEFNYKGIDHIKYFENLDLGSVYTNYQFVVLDMGDIRHSPFKDELKRSHIKCVVASADEWKEHWIEKFLSITDVIDPIFLVPCSDVKITNDLAARLKYYDVYPLDKHINPYKVPEGSIKVYDRLLKDYQVQRGTRIGTKHLVMTGVLGAIIAAIGFTVFTFY